jgi:fructokinase
MRIGVDLGGTKIEALALSSTGHELYRQRVATPRQAYDDIVRAIADLVRAVERYCGAEGSVGVGIPGVTSPASGLVKNANTVELIGHPLARDLQAALHREVRIANDANCFALSEAVDGAASEGALGFLPECVFAVILGTGTGGGVVVNGKVLTGADSIGGEWGHNPLPWQEPEEYPGPQCWCGQRGCIETFLSGPGMERTHARLGGQKRSASEIAHAATHGDASAARTLAVYQSQLARGLASIINVLNPDAIVMGGGVSNVASLYRTVPQLWKSYVFSDQVTTRLVQARHGDSSGVRGAAWLWPSEDNVQG